METIINETTLKAALNVIAIQTEHTEKALATAPKSKKTAAQEAYMQGMRTMLEIILTDYYNHPMPDGVNPY